MGKETYYFSHDSNAFTDTKILNMRADYGLESYGLYWAIIEMMRNEKDYKLELNKNTYRAIKTLTNPRYINDIEKFIEDCIEEYKLFDKDDFGKFYSKSLLKRMEEKERKQQEQYLKRSEAGRIGGIRSGETRRNQSKNEANRSNALSNEAKEKENKENKNKEKENKENEIKKEQEEKIHFADFVTMTNVEYEKLVNTHGKKFADQCIEVLDNYKGSSGKTYISDYRAILSWVVGKVKEMNFKRQTSKGGIDDFKELMEEAKDEQNGNNTNNNPFSW